MLIRLIATIEYFIVPNYYLQFYFFDETTSHKYLKKQVVCFKVRFVVPC